MTTYAPSYNDPLTTTALTNLNAVLVNVATQLGFTVADGYGAFKLASQSTGGDPCAAGLLIKLPDGTCNIHPSELGRQVLAGAVLAVVQR